MSVVRKLTYQMFCGYEIGVLVAQRRNWMYDARQFKSCAKDKELIAACVRNARDRNHDLVRVLQRLEREDVCPPDCAWCKAEARSDE